MGKKWDEFVGSYEEVEDKIKEYYREYPENAYQTKKLDDVFNNGIRKVVMVRNKTCD